MTGCNGVSSVYKITGGGSAIYRLIGEVYTLIAEIQVELCSKEETWRSFDKVLLKCGCASIM